MIQNSKRTKKHILSLSLIVFISLIIFSQTALAWDDCPFGYVDDPYPGVCPRYIDTNKDGICDRSQTEPSSVKTEPIDTTGEPAEESEIYSAGIPWYENDNLIILLISLFMIVSGIFLTRYVNKHDVIPAWKTRIIWNILLLIFFLPSSISGILLVTHASFPLPQSFLQPILQIHTITSFFFMWISGFHILLHPKYYSRCTKKLMTTKDPTPTTCKTKDNSTSKK